mmetsp:Transcript_16346/g.33281  ORF Transcript_16346/g.33281 Transcript_16346/m.33281 type:complete len:213 (+) Transcript_16346:1690-2328(+)
MTRTRDPRKSVRQPLFWFPDPSERPAPLPTVADTPDRYEAGTAPRAATHPRTHPSDSACMNHRREIRKHFRHHHKWMDSPSEGLPHRRSRAAGLPFSLHAQNWDLPSHPSLVHPPWHLQHRLHHDLSLTQPPSSPHSRPRHPFGTLRRMETPTEEYHPPRTPPELTMHLSPPPRLRHHLLRQNPSFPSLHQQPNFLTHSDPQPPHSTLIRTS